MGMRQVVDHLEARLRDAERKAAHADEMRDYIETLAQMPDDATLLYTLSGMCVQHSIGRSARVLLGRMK